LQARQQGLPNSAGSELVSNIRQGTTDAVLWTPGGLLRRLLRRLLGVGLIAEPAVKWGRRSKIRESRPSPMSLAEVSSLAQRRLVEPHARG
jgi:hypothetical protein